MNLYYLGPIGTHSYEAARMAQLQWFPEAEMMALGTIQEAVTAVFNASEDDVVLACVPIENSIQGAVTQTWDSLTAHIVEQRAGRASQIQILAALTLPIHHYAVFHEGADWGAVTEVYSHPQALAQCQNNLIQAFPRAVPVSVSSTAEAVRKIAMEGLTNAVALASQGAADYYRLKYHENPLEDKAGNVTRFAIIGNRRVFSSVNANSRSEHVASLCLRGVAHQPGGLVGALLPFADAGFNLLRVESRPVGDQLGNYVFYVDVGVALEKDDTENKAFHEVLEQLRNNGTDIVWLGDYSVVQISK